MIADILLMVLVLFNIWFIMFTDHTKFICWNCRGVSSRDTTSRVLHLMNKFRPTLICLVETRTNDDRLQRFCAKLKS